MEDSRSAEVLVDSSRSKQRLSRSRSIRSPRTLRTEVWPRPLSDLWTLPIARSDPHASADGGSRG